jgi:hypothetical protein
MRLFVVSAVLAAAFAMTPAAFAQNSHGRVSQDQLQSNDKQRDIEQQHPDWFTEPAAYKPCPASVAFSGDRHACLG